MQVVPVIDVLGGVVVRGVAGERRRYGPWTDPLGGSSDPPAIAQAFRERLGLAEIYLADLDAIRGAEPNWDLYQGFMDSGASLWIDAGLSDAKSANDLARFADDHPAVTGLVAGLETIENLQVLSCLVDCAGSERAVFSLDLWDGESRAASDDLSRMTPGVISQAALSTGVRRWIVLDVAQVGTGGGPAAVVLAACRQIKRLDPHARVAAGGGIRSSEDLLALQAAGVDAALVASALHQGRIGREELEMLAGR